MKTQKNRLNISQATEGFTLVELMIVVSIIGVLSAIAIPQYNLFQAQARATEGKVQLSAAYSAEKTFFAQNAFYTPCLNTAGYAPDGYPAGTAGVGGTTRYYTIGFVSAPCTGNAGDPAICRANPPTSCNDTPDGETYYLANASIGGPPTTRADLVNYAVVEPTAGVTFTLDVAGNVGLK